MTELFINATFWERMLEVWSVLAAFWTVWLPVLLGTLFVSSWKRYVRAKFIAAMDAKLLEIRIPRDIAKSPAAMEVVLNALYQTTVGDLLKVFLRGNTRAWYSLEIASIGGAVKFYVWVPNKYRNIVESQLYSQYPSIEIHEAEDYTRDVTFDFRVNNMHGSQLTLTKPDPYPIKTYVDYGLDKDPKEEYKVDPLTAVIEFMGSVKPQEQAWVQILIQAHKEEGIKEWRIKKKPAWKDAAKKEIKKIIKESVFAPDPSDVNARKLDYSKLSPAEKDAIMAIERSIAKHAFDTMIRIIYFAPKEAYNSGMKPALVQMFRSFNSLHLNGFKQKWGPVPDYPWQDFKKFREKKNKTKLLDAYKRRSFFHPPYLNWKSKPFILTTEELATIFHPPGEVSKTPTFERILSRKSEAPANLPVG